jgi:hypothetical protein
MCEVPSKLFSVCLTVRLPSKIADVFVIFIFYFVVLRVRWRNRRVDQHKTNLIGKGRLSYACSMKLMFIVTAQSGETPLEYKTKLS